MESAIEDLTTVWEKFTLMEEEDEQLSTPKDEWVPMVEWGSACVVGKLLADENVGKEIIKTPLIWAWQPTWRVTFKTLGTNMFLIDFENGWDNDRIMEGRPWTFDGHLVSLANFDGLTPVPKIEFEKVAFWVCI
jgi:hypothetical protein